MLSANTSTFAPDADSRRSSSVYKSNRSNGVSKSEMNSSASRSSNAFKTYFSTSTNPTSKGYTRYKEQSYSDCFRKVIKGRCYLEPLTSPATDMDKSNRAHSISRNHGDGFGEIDFLRSKLGFLLPTVEDTLKTLSLNDGKRGEVFKTADGLKRIRRSFQRAHRVYDTSAMSLDDIYDHSKERQENEDQGDTRTKRPTRAYFTNYDIPLYPEFPVHIGKPIINPGVGSGNRPVNAVTSKTRNKSNVDLLLKSFESSPSKMKHNIDRAILPNEHGGGFVTYTRKQIESMYELDEKMLERVKKKIRHDRRKLAIIGIKRREESFRNSNIPTTSGLIPPSSMETEVDTLQGLIRNAPRRSRSLKTAKLLESLETSV